jgi:D-alanyl-D-alanine dipeptidase
MPGIATLQTELALYSDTAVAAFEQVNTRKAGYRSHMLNLEAPEQQEPLRDVRAFGLKGRNHYAAAFNPPYDGPIPGAIPFLWLRTGVIERLLKVEARVRLLGFSLFLFDAWRPQAIQHYFHDHWFPAWLRVNRPDIAEADLPAAVAAYWAAPTAVSGTGPSLSPSPHSTGAALDCTLQLADASQAWMGSLFDDVTDIAHTDAFEGRTLLAMSDILARKHRRILYHAMAAEGFANNPTEWWHFSYGDQFWARMTGAAEAIYGAAEPPSPI